MAEDSLYDLSSFLNCQFWRVGFPFEKNTKLHILYAAWCCLGGFGRLLDQQGIRLEPRMGGKEDGYSSPGDLSSCASTACDQDPRVYACWWCGLMDFSYRD